MTHPILAQSSNYDNIQVLSSSSYIDRLGNFHIIGEVNNTSNDPQNQVKINSALYDSFKNTIGNASSKSYIETLRPGELSPFSITVNKPEQVKNTAHYELTVTSQTSQEKPAYLSLNINNTYLDNNKNPHIAGKITNKGTLPVSSMKVIGTLYNNLSQVIGTNITNINSKNLSQGQSAQFDIEINKNHTKSQIEFFSLNTESPQYAIITPINSKATFPYNPTSNNTAHNQVTVDSKGVASSNIKQPLLLPQQSISPKDSSPNNPSTDKVISKDESDANNENKDTNKNNDNDDKQRGEYLVDDNGQHYYDTDNCSEEKGSSDGDLSECEDAEKETQQEDEIDESTAKEGEGNDDKQK
jgi:hypothetical protein